MALNPLATLGEIGEEVEQGMAQQGKALKQIVISQVTGKTSAQTQGQQSSQQHPVSTFPASDTGTNEAAQAAVQAADQHATKNFVNELYAPSDPLEKNTEVQMQTLTKGKSDVKTPEELQKIAALKSQLHQEMYYEPIFDRPKEPEKRQGEEREKEEEEKSQQLEALKEQEKREAPPMAVQQAALARERKFGAG